MLLLALLQTQRPARGVLRTVTCRLTPDMGSRRASYTLQSHDILQDDLEDERRAWRHGARAGLAVAERRRYDEPASAALSYHLSSAQLSTARDQQQYLPSRGGQLRT